MKTVVGLFNRFEDAEHAVVALEDAGFNRNNFNVIARQDAVKLDQAGFDTMADDDVSRASIGAGTGAVGGSVLGGLAGLLVGMGALVIPGIGPVISAGTLAAALGSTGLGAAIGAGVGAVAGGLIGALVDVGIPEEDAHFYAEGVKRGGILVVTQADDVRAPVAAGIMQQANAVDVETQREIWRAAGWIRFDETIQPDERYPRL